MTGSAHCGRFSENKFGQGAKKINISPFFFYHFVYSLVLMFIVDKDD